tara:strand:- start:530 stop:4633 length:4104 start_codon:yes stop_codon:yes gene_type:complete
MDIKKEEERLKKQFKKNRTSSRINFVSNNQNTCQGFLIIGGSFVPGLANTLWWYLSKVDYDNNNGVQIATQQQLIDSINNSGQIPSGLPLASIVGEISLFQNRLWALVRHGGFTAESIGEWIFDTSGTIPTITFNRLIENEPMNGMSGGSGVDDYNFICRRLTNILPYEQELVNVNVSGTTAVITNIFTFPSGSTSLVSRDALYISSSNTYVTSGKLDHLGNVFDSVNHWDANGNLLGFVPVDNNGNGYAFGICCFDGEIIVSRNTGSINQIYTVNLTNYTLSSTVFNGIYIGDMASNPACCEINSADPPCYNIGDIGPGGGIVFALPNTGINNSNFVYEISADPIQLATTPLALLPNECKNQKLLTITTIDVGQTVPNNAIVVDYGLGSNNPSFFPSDINVGDILNAFDINGNGLFSPGVVPTVTLKTLLPNNFVFIAFSAFMNGPANSQPSETVTFYTTPGFVPVNGAEWGGHDRPIITSELFGEGKKNTDIISLVTQTNNPPSHPTVPSHDIAADLTLAFSQNNLDDWFLPSYEELEEAFNVLGSNGLNMLPNPPGINNEKTVYWTSTGLNPVNNPLVTLLQGNVNSNEFAWAYITPFNTHILYRKCKTLSVLPVRRFECKQLDPDPCLEPDVYTPSNPYNAIGNINCVDYNYRDGACGFTPGFFCSSSKASGLNYSPNAVNSGGGNPGGPNPAPPAGSPSNNIQGDSVIGDDTLVFMINKLDVKGHKFTLQELQDDSVGYTITIWDADYVFLGKWVYNTFESIVDLGAYFGDSNNDWDVVELRVKHPTHLQGPYPIVDYSRTVGSGSMTMAYFKIEFAATNNPNYEFENAINNTWIGNLDSSFYTNTVLTSQLPIACIPQQYWYNNPAGLLLGNCQRWAATFHPVNCPLCLDVFPDLATALASGNCSQTQQNNNCTPCPPNGYQIGDVGPGGGTIVATPWNGGSSPGNNHSPYYFEIAPEDIDLCEWGNTNVDMYNPGYLNGTGETEGSINMDEVILNYAPIPTVFPQFSNAFGISNSYSSNGYDDWFLPSIEELWFARMNLTGHPNALTGFRWSSNFFDDQFDYNYLGTPLALTYQNSIVGGNIALIGGTYGQLSSNVLSSSTKLALAVDMDSPITHDPVTGFLTVGQTVATELPRSQPLKVRPMRKFLCNISTPLQEKNTRTAFANSQQNGLKNKPEETGPFSIAGYFPLYDTIKGASDNSPNSSGYHIHEFEGTEYYMPNGLGGPGSGLQFHGDYKGTEYIEDKSWYTSENGMYNNADNFAYFQKFLNTGETTKMADYLIEDIENVEKERFNTLKVVETTEEVEIIQDEQDIQPIEPVYTPPPIVIPPEEDEEPPPTPTPTYTPPPSTPSGGSSSGGGGY